MRDFDQAIERLGRQWDSTAAHEVVRGLVTALWQASGRDEKTQQWADEIRQLLRDRLAGDPSPAERLALLNICYSLEQGVGNRDEALALAERVEPLARQAASPLDRVRATFQLAKALLYVNRNADAVEWTRRGLQIGDEVDRTASLSPAERTDLRRLLADQESRQVNRMATLGGMSDEVDRAVESVLKRWAELNDPTGFAAGLGMLVEARVFQGRWSEAADLARQALAAVGYPANMDAGILYDLCFGGLALCRLGDAETALKWTADAEVISQRVGNHECVMESRSVHAVALAGVGRSGEALRQIDAVVEESVVLNMSVLTHWVASLRGWIRMSAGLPSPPEEFLEASEYMSAHGYHVMAAEMLYGAACALRLAGREHHKPLADAIAGFERYDMAWHLDFARRGEVIGYRIGPTTGGGL